MLASYPEVSTLPEGTCPPPELTRLAGGDTKPSLCFLMIFHLSHQAKDPFRIVYFAGGRMFFPLQMFRGDFEYFRYTFITAISVVKQPAVFFKHRWVCYFSEKRMLGSVD